LLRIFKRYLPTKVFNLIWVTFIIAKQNHPGVLTEVIAYQRNAQGQLQGTITTMNALPIIREWQPEQMAKASSVKKESFVLEYAP
jgi:hypothetical protein